MKKILKCLMITIGTLIGAGFASGKEIATFFNRFSDQGLAGIIFASVLFGGIVVVILWIANKRKVTAYQSLVKNRYLKYVIKVFTLICFCIMISAIGTYGKEQFHLNFWVGTFLASLLCFFFFLLKLKGLERINNVLVPIILLGIVLISCTLHLVDAIPEGNASSASFLLSNWLQSAILYVGYNSILLIPILMELGEYHFQTREIWLLGLLVTLMLCLAGLMIFSDINAYYPEILNTEMPMLFVAKLSHPAIYQLYNVAILFAIFTTAFSCGYAFLRMHSEKNYFRNCVFICVMSVLIARIGFSNLINWCFPIFGYVGLLQMLYILIVHRNKK